MGKFVTEEALADLLGKTTLSVSRLSGWGDLPPAIVANGKKLYDLDDDQVARQYRRDRCYDLDEEDKQAALDFDRREALAAQEKANGLEAAKRKLQEAEQAAKRNPSTTHVAIFMQAKKDLAKLQAEQGG